MSLDTVITHNTIQPSAPSARPDACALVLMGGGARTAYQAGVLKAVAAMLPAGSGSSFPFPWLFGTSAGALNASFLASHAGEGAGALGALAQFWLGLRSHQVYRLDAPRWVRDPQFLVGLRRD